VLVGRGVQQEHGMEKGTKKTITCVTTAAPLLCWALPPTRGAAARGAAMDVSAAAAMSPSCSWRECWAIEPRGLWAIGLGN